MLTTSPPHQAQDMDFVVSQPLERCAYRLALVEERREIAFVPRLTLHLSQIDADTYAFRLHESHDLPIIIEGELHRLDQQRTYVSGLAMIDRPRLLAELGTLLVFALASALLIGPLMVLIGLPLLMLYLSHYHQATHDEYGRLIHLLRGTLA